MLLDNFVHATRSTSNMVSLFSTWCYRWFSWLYDGSHSVKIVSVCPFPIQLTGAPTTIWAGTLATKSPTLHPSLYTCSCLPSEHCSPWNNSQWERPTPTGGSWDVRGSSATVPAGSTTTWMAYYRTTSKGIW